MADRVIWYLFILGLALLALAYYVGLKSDAAAVSAAVNSLILNITGRDKNGKFAGYPKPA